jgi:hypothetical protein
VSYPDYNMTLDPRRIEKIECLRRQFERDTGIRPVGKADQWHYDAPVAHLSYVQWLESKIVGAYD